MVRQWAGTAIVKRIALVGRIAIHRLPQTVRHQIRVHVKLRDINVGRYRIAFAIQRVAHGERTRRYDRHAGGAGDRWCIRRRHPQHAVKPGPVVGAEGDVDGEGAVRPHRDGAQIRRPHPVGLPRPAQPGGPLQLGHAARIQVAAHQHPVLVELGDDDLRLRGGSASLQRQRRQERTRGGFLLISHLLSGPQSAWASYINLFPLPQAGKSFSVVLQTVLALAGTMQLKRLAERDATVAIKGRGIYAASTWATVWCAHASGRAAVEAA